MISTPEIIALIKSLLENFKPFALKECTFAIELIEEIPRLR